MHDFRLTSSWLVTKLDGAFGIFKAIKRIQSTLTLHISQRLSALSLSFGSPFVQVKTLDGRSFFSCVTAWQGGSGLDNGLVKPRHLVVPPLILLTPILTRASERGWVVLPLRPRHINSHDSVIQILWNEIILWQSSHISRNLWHVHLFTCGSFPTILFCCLLDPYGCACTQISCQSGI